MPEHSRKWDLLSAKTQLHNAMRTLDTLCGLGCFDKESLNQVKGLRSRLSEYDKLSLNDDEVFELSALLEEFDNLEIRNKLQLAEA